MNTQRSVLRGLGLRKCRQMSEEDGERVWGRHMRGAGWAFCEMKIKIKWVHDDMGGGGSFTDRVA